MTRTAPFAALIFLLAVFAGFAPASALDPTEVRLADYLPAGVDYDPAIPVPSSVLGFEVGEWHVRHDQLVAYLEKLAQSSERIELTVTGHTYEQRPLLLLKISSPRNLGRLEKLRQEHLKLSDPNVPKPDTSKMPVFVYLGYSVHGNEASGSNASLLTAYHLAAARGPAIDQLLGNAVILLDPSLNPDGLGRFAAWANMHRGKVPVGDPDHREHVEGWPNGRTNHYWFDLNRDWLPLVHPESRARLTSFHHYRPNLLTDFHEMGSNATYFFQPGVPSRQNPLTPARNFELTREIAKYHAAALDERGRLYYTEETFDDFYYGKGSTYPDVNGTVGILFEQASARGHVQETVNGDLTFPFAIHNQFLTSLSSLQAALEKRVELLDYQADFYRQALERASRDDVGGWVFGDPHDAARTHLLVDLLRRHRIEVHRLGRTLSADGVDYEPEWAHVVPLEQAQYWLIRALFERRTEFADSTFYDVSTWTLPLAFGLPHAALEGKTFAADLLGERIDTAAAPRGRLIGPADGDTGEGGQPYAYVFEWDGYFAPRALYRLLAGEARARVATQPFNARVGDRERRFDYGTIVVPLGIQENPPAEIAAIIHEIVAEDGIDVFEVSTGLTPQGIDLGSPSLAVVDQPRPLLVVGRGISTYEAGEIWHLLDQRFEIPLPLIDRERLPRMNLHEYTHLILVDGDYGLGDDMAERIGHWVRDGGILIATKRAAAWVDEKLRAGESRAPAPADDDSPERLPYAEHRKNREVRMISGAIFEVELDVTHPLAYGYRRPTLPFFRNSRIFLAGDDNPYIAVAQYAAEPLLSGYVSKENLGRLEGTPALLADRLGRGTTVRMVDNPNFRGFWYGTNKLLLNALFFGSVIEPTWEAREREGR